MRARLFNADGNRTIHAAGASRPMERGDGLCLSGRLCHGTMAAYLREFPAASVARDQLRNSAPELSTHENQRVTAVLEDSIWSVLDGSTPAEQALSTAQERADRILARYR